MPYEALPSINHVEQNGTFSWLSGLPAGDSALDFERNNANVLVRLDQLSEQAATQKLQLPSPFTQFLSSPEIYRRVPTCTSCYLDLSTTLLDAPGADGKLIRFMNDQQCVLLWYLFLRVGYEPSVVVAIPEWLDDSDDKGLDEAVRLTNLTMCAGTFEEFMFRFWLENTIWYSLYEGRVLTDFQYAYVRAAKAARPQV